MFIGMEGKTMVNILSTSIAVVIIIACASILSAMNVPKQLVYGISLLLGYFVQQAAKKKLSKNMTHRWDKIESTSSKGQHKYGLSTQFIENKVARRYKELADTRTDLSEDGIIFKIMAEHNLEEKYIRDVIEKSKSTNINVTMTPEGEIMDLYSELAQNRNDLSHDGIIFKIEKDLKYDENFIRKVIKDNSKTT
jgi:hypothetical protein